MARSWTPHRHPLQSLERLLSQRRHPLNNRLRRIIPKPDELRDAHCRSLDAWLTRDSAQCLRLALSEKFNDIRTTSVLRGREKSQQADERRSAHTGHAIAGETAVAGRAADIDARLNVQAGVVADLDRRLGQIDKAVETPTSKGRTASAMALAEQQRKVRAELVAQRTTEAQTLASLQVEKATVDGARRVAEADLGPVRQLANLVGAGDQDVLRYFIPIVAPLLDPAVVLLLLAAASAQQP